MTPYFESGRITLYHCDWHEVDWDKHGKFDLLLTDPPYGLGEAKGKNKSRTKLAVAKDYGVSDWDDKPPSDFDLIWLRDLATWQIMWGGNYFVLPPSKCWLVWDKENSGDFADCELAWTNLDKAVRIFRYLWNGMIKEQPEYRMHPTQKPLALMKWCITQAPSDVKTVVDPYSGSGTTLVAAKALGLSAVGVEQDEKSCEDAAVRLQQENFDWEVI